jgi:signal transduction histidine kinase
VITLLHRLRVRQVAGRINARFTERLAERDLVAQELQDTLLQGFLSASMQVHVARERLPEDSPVKPILTRSLCLMSKVIEEGRNALRGIRATGTLSPNLEDAFAQIPKEFSSRDTNEAPVEFRLSVEGPKKALNPLLRDEIYRIGREGLTNAFRHASARHVEVELTYGARDFRLVVCDDGRGVDQDALQQGPNGHGGLSLMRERAHRMGASFHVFSRPSAGTEVYLSVPGCVAYEGGTHRQDATPALPGEDSTAATG